MRVRLVLLALILFSILTLQHSFTSKTYNRQTVHEFSPPDSKGRCSATAIGPRAILTAAHCDGVGDTIGIDGERIHIDRRIVDGKDHIIYLVSGHEFVYWADVDSIGTEVPQTLYMWGCPGGMILMYRQGVLSGFVPFDHYQMAMIDMQSFFGDSGAGIFNNRGRLVLVTNMSYWNENRGSRFQLTASKPMAFSKAQIKEAQLYGTNRIKSYFR